MEFSPANPVIQLCLKGMALEENNKSKEAGEVFQNGWELAANDFEKYLSAYFLGRIQKNPDDKLKWFETALQFALKINSESVKSAYPTLYTNIARCYEELNEPENAKKNHDLAISFTKQPDDQGPFFHGTKADLKTGDLLTAGKNSNYQEGLVMNHIYFTALVHGAGLAAALANGNGPQRVYIVEPTGSFENDPNVTDKKFPGNPTRSYRTSSPLKITGEIKDWAKLRPEEIEKWKEKLANNKGEIIN